MANGDIELGKYSLGWSDPEKNVFNFKYLAFFCIYFKKFII